MNKKKQIMSSADEEEKTRKPTSGTSQEDDDEVEGVDTTKREKKGTKKPQEGLESGKEFNTAVFRLLKA